MQFSPASRYFLSLGLRPNTNSVLFTDTFNLCFSFEVRDQLPHLYRTRGEFADIHILILTLTDTKTKHSEFNFIHSGPSH
jgi:hypothetical protein